MTEKSDNTKLVRLSRSLEEEFNRLPNSGEWDPTGFPEFVREAVRAYLDWYKGIGRFEGIRVPRRPDPSPE